MHTVCGEFDERHGEPVTSEDRNTGNDNEFNSGCPTLIQPSELPQTVVCGSSRHHGQVFVI
jgi:hypothetical protein